ncbi:hypothetical protein CYMTET_16990 [Cymbomonas tetramitiformis]|uniref:Uncharacterized protein n=1 Tax=Cymbomonas tetramitiformis TaxID=36881 RepID=A0AAE0GCC4_9CHLO|nr:hypothetical protein CYMTET_16990 [Cymbomonas tetramitiformis]
MQTRQAIQQTQIDAPAAAAMAASMVPPAGVPLSPELLKLIENPVSLTGPRREPEILHAFVFSHARLVDFASPPGFVP